MIFKKRHNINNLEFVKKNVFFNNHTVDVFLFVTAIISLLVTSIVLFMICKHTKLKSLVTSLALQPFRKVNAITKQEHVSIMHDIECTCKIQWYTICMLIISILGIIVFVILNVRKLKVFRRHLVSNAVKIMLFISDSQYYILVKLCRTAGSIHLFKITGKLISEHIKLKRKILWNVIEIDRKEVNMTLNGNKISLPSSVIIPLRDNFKIRCIIK